jgi:hypothetical protein
VLTPLSLYIKEEENSKMGKSPSRVFWEIGRGEGRNMVWEL